MPLPVRIYSQKILLICLLADRAIIFLVAYGKLLSVDPLLVQRAQSNQPPTSLIRSLDAIFSAGRWRRDPRSAAGHSRAETPDEAEP
jgi:hypothetical protein